MVFHSTFLDSCGASDQLTGFMLNAIHYEYIFN
jgi:hypothetical protein